MTGAKYGLSRPPPLAAQLSSLPNFQRSSRLLFLSPSVILTKAAFLCSHTDKPHRFVNPTGK